MTTPHDDLHARLAVLVADRLPDEPATPPAYVLLRSGMRRRWRSRVGVALVVAVVAPIAELLIQPLRTTIYQQPSTTYAFTVPRTF